MQLHPCPDQAKKPYWPEVRMATQLFKNIGTFSDLNTNVAGPFAQTFSPHLTKAHVCTKVLTGQLKMDECGNE